MILKGWVEHVRDIGKIKFVVLRRGNERFQVTVSTEKCSSSVLKEIDKLTRESVIEVEGEFHEHPEAPGGKEFIPLKMKILSLAEPLKIEYYGDVKTKLDTRLDWRPIDLRNPMVRTIFLVQSKVVEKFSEYLLKKNFIQVFTPCIIGAASEGGAEVFKVNYFGKETFLRQDPQLHRQLTIAGGLEKIFEIGPNWRAEPSHTTRHLCEHRGCAVEQAFIKDEFDLMKLQEEMLKYVLGELKKELVDELELLGMDIEPPRKKFPVISFPKVYDILREYGEEIPYGEEYGRRGETVLAEYVKEKYGMELFFVHRFPFNAKPFYVMKVDEDPFWTRSIDVVFRGVEISTGGQREHRYEKLIEQVNEKGLRYEDIEWFVKFFKYGVPPHGGFNIGIERLVKQIIGLQNIREAVLFPRAPERLFP